MRFSLSSFTVEINSVPTIAFQAKWQADAEVICRAWIEAHWTELSTTGPHGSAARPIYKVRMARAFERAAFGAADDGVEFYGDVKIVRLVDVTEHSDELSNSVLTTDNQSDETAAERDTHDNDGRNSTS
jgi:hypothetical protein